jgi:transposase-like protein
MAFWKPTKTKKMESKSPDTGKAIRTKKKTRHSSPVTFEAKMLAIEAIIVGADRQDVCEVLGVKPTTVSNWLKLYREEGIGGLCRKPSNNAVRKQCSELEKRIVAHRRIVTSNRVGL